MGLTMWFQQKLNPAPTNNDQAKMFALMPVFFTFMLGQFASGLVIYWTLSNILSIIQQKVIMRKNGVK
jgi:YidC/Oxa1 family membrane protein insertase